MALNQAFTPNGIRCSHEYERKGLWERDIP